MKAPILYFITIAILFCTSCKKLTEAIVDKALDKPESNAAAQGFIQYTIKKGAHFTSGNVHKKVETSQMAFIVKFDSSAIYKSLSEENQYDINKLYGFSDNNSDHHRFSARFGWRWSDGALRLFGYVYNDGAVISKELTTIKIGAETACAIQVIENNYLFTVNGDTTSLPRKSITAIAMGYQLYPYFGGNEVAPHDVTILIKAL